MNTQKKERKSRPQTNNQSNKQTTEPSKQTENKK